MTAMFALDGVKVLDAVSMLAGPYGAMLLGDMGAEVIKLEPPAGDETRRMGPRKGADSGVFVGVNRNKRGVALNLATADGQQALARLARWADIVVHKLRPKARLTLGLDYESLRRHNPRVISVSVSTFGASGPYTGRPRPFARRPGGWYDQSGAAGGHRAGSPALLLYTSGTTGKSKGVVHGHRVLLGHHAVDYALNYVRPDDVAYSPVDRASAGGLLLGLLVPLAHGIPVVAFRETRFAADRTLRVLHDCGVSVGLFPPTALCGCCASRARSPGLSPAACGCAAW